MKDMEKINVVSLNIGTVKNLEYKGQEVLSGINKLPVQGRVYLTKTQLQGDQQADLINHGGEEKAVCAYSFEHYPYWEKKLNKELACGAFGENLTLQRGTEDSICIGDVYQWGQAMLQVCQPRVPCHKLAKKHQSDELPVLVQETGYTGFYFRVLQEGEVSVQDELLLRERDTAQVSIAFLNSIRYHRPDDKESIRKALAVDALAESWRKYLVKKLD